MSKSLRVVGLDPGSRKAGWGVIDIDLGQRKLRHVDNGVLMLNAKAALPDRLVELSRGLRGVVEEYRPTAAAVEDVFVRKGARSALILGQARGAMLATCGLMGLEVTGYATSQVKTRTTGKGRASKEQVAHMVTILLALGAHPYEDAADALAVAVCHALTVVDVTPRATLPKAPAASKKKGRDALLALARAQGKI